eukprot:TRINITY_DN10237_c0_g1_i1.p1 TRINITY_DN10237_c0_g1~~TRINITY_DN10237_c0_g1_i1.p1  ORF type:complete len:459 (-),score=102.71 TRINITY_DN10237_c0_g1_i1:91-1467(-)
MRKDHQENEEEKLLREFYLRVQQARESGPVEIQYLKRSGDSKSKRETNSSSATMDNGNEDILYKLSISEESHQHRPSCEPLFDHHGDGDDNDETQHRRISSLAFFSPSSTAVDQHTRISHEYGAQHKQTTLFHPLRETSLQQHINIAGDLSLRHMGKKHAWDDAEENPSPTIHTIDPIAPMKYHYEQPPEDLFSQLLKESYDTLNRQHSDEAFHSNRQPQSILKRQTMYTPTELSHLGTKKDTYRDSSSQASASSSSHTSNHLQRPETKEIEVQTEDNLQQRLRTSDVMTRKIQSIQPHRSNSTSPGLHRGLISERKSTAQTPKKKQTKKKKASKNTAKSSDVHLDLYLEKNKKRIQNDITPKKLSSTTPPKTRSLSIPKARHDGFRDNPPTTKNPTSRRGAPEKLAVQRRSASSSKVNGRIISAPTITTTTPSTSPHRIILSNVSPKAPIYHGLRFK